MRRRIVSLLAVGVCIGAGALFVEFESGAQTTPEVFSLPQQVISETSASLPQPDVRRDPLYPRTRLAEVRLPVLTSARAGLEVRLDLFDDVRYIARTTGVDQRAPGESTWRADIVGAPFGWAKFEIVGDVVFGRVVIPGQMFVVRYAGNGLHSIRQVNPTVHRMDRDTLDLAVGQHQATGNPSSRAVMTFAYLGVYSKAARKELGGKAAMKAMINMTISDFNDGAAAAGVDHRLKLTKAKKIRLKDTGNTVLDLLSINNRFSGTVDSQTHGLRNRTGSDFVGWYTKAGRDGSCGVSWRPDSIAPGNESFMYSVIQSDCNDGIAGGAHELLHNMTGCHPKEFNDCATASSPYSFGFFVKNAKGVPTPSAMTILGTFLPAVCGGGGNDCTMLPTMSFKGKFGQNKAGNNKANMARTVNTGATTFAGFR